MAKPETRALKRSFAAGIGGLAVIGLVLYVTFKAMSGLPFVPRTTVKAAFDNVDSLTAGSAVRQNSKRIGQVSKLEYRDGTAVAFLEINNSDYKAYRNARAAIWDRSALGTKFVEIRPGSPEAGPLGDRIIRKTRTVDSYDLYQTLNILDKPTRNATRRLLQQTGGGLAGRGADLQDFVNRAPELLPDLGTVSSALAASEADLPALLRSANQLAGRFDGREQQIGSLLNQTQVTFDSLTVDDARPLNATLDRAPQTLDTVRTALDSLERPLRDTRSAVTNLEPGAQALAASERDLRGTLREGVPVVQKVPGVAGQAKPAIGALIPMMADARPLAPRVTEGLDRAATLLGGIAPYGPDIGQWFVRAASFVSMGPAPNNRYAYINANPQFATATTGLPGVDGCNFRQSNYPEPGTATDERVAGGGPSGVPCIGLGNMVPLSKALGANDNIFGGDR